VIGQPVLNLQPEEEVLSAFEAQTPNAFSRGGGLLWLILDEGVRTGNRVVVMTDRRTLVFQAGAWRTRTLKRLIRELLSDRPVELKPVPTKRFLLRTWSGDPNIPARTTSEPYVLRTESFGEPLIAREDPIRQAIARAGPTRPRNPRQGGDA
jgi:hypothetical protein